MSPLVPTAPPTVRQCLQRGSLRLRQKEVSSPELDSALLLAHAIGQKRSWLYAHPDSALTDGEKALWLSCLAQRQARRPLPYIVGYKEFMGLRILVDERVLIPRPETELVVELAQQFLRGDPGATIADIGTGSGCIALAVARLCPETQVFAADASATALQVAQDNAYQLGLTDRVSFSLGDLLTPSPGHVSLLLANLPYVAAKEYASLAPEITDYEPQIALVSGQEGLDHLQRLVAQLGVCLLPGGRIILECGSTQALTVLNMLRHTGLFAGTQVHSDLAGLDRCVSAWGFRGI